ncbi:MAG: DUF2085 domain-containing protein [Promethearchaeota archaeon]
MCYFYISEIFGSISSPYQEDSKFFVQFGFTLLIFTFFSVLAGSFHGFIAGFIGEYLYQLAYYQTVYLDWCLLIAFWGFICGIYKYKPLKYQEKLKVFYTVLCLFLYSAIMVILIVIIQKNYYLINDNINSIIFNYGFKFFIQSLITIIFFVPILLFLYDKGLATQERHWYFMILTHHPISASDHTFHFKFGRTYVYFCSRCSGVIIGGMIATFYTHLIEKIYNVEFSPELAVLLCIILPIPGLIDWGTQRMLLRKSTTESRLLTGFIIGAALHLMSFTYNKYYFFMLFLLTLYFSILFLLMYFGNRKEMRLQKEEFEHNFPSNSGY